MGNRLAVALQIYGLIRMEQDLQTSWGLTAGAHVQVLYAITLIPAGLLADRVDRPRLLAGGLAAWSLLTMVAAKVNSQRHSHYSLLKQLQRLQTGESAWFLERGLPACNPLHVITCTLAWAWNSWCHAMTHGLPFHCMLIC